MIKSPLAIRVGRALCTFLVAVAVIGPAASALAANIQTDLFVYQSGDTVTVTGDGFGANRQRRRQRRRARSRRRSGTPLRDGMAPPFASRPDSAR